MSRAEDVIAEALWASADDKGVKGRLYQVDTQYLAVVAVEAIRNLSPDDLAELIDGEVQTSHPDAAQGIGELTCLQRVVGPWQETP